MTKFYTFAKTYGNVVLHRGYNNGKPVTEKVEFKPSFYVKSKSNNPEWKSLYGEPLDRIKLASINEAKDFRKKYDDVSGFEIHGMERYEYQFIAEQYPADLTISAKDLRILILDLEVIGEKDSGFPDVEKVEHQICLISVHDSAANKTIVFGSRPFDDSKDDFEYRQFRNETELLKGFLDFWEAKYPDIISGWNTEGFDQPYLINRMVKVLGMEQARRLSPFRILKETTIELMNKKVQTYDVYGVTFLDYMALYKKYGAQGQKESYSLSAISQDELGKDKLENPTSSFYDFWNDHYDTFVRYNAMDSILVQELDNKLKLFDLVLAITYLMKCNIEDSLGVIRPWDCKIYNELLKKNIAVPPNKMSARQDFPGAWVKDTIVGFHRWVVSFDFASLYPSIVRQWNMSPETIIDDRLDITVRDIVAGCSDKAKEAHDLGCTLAANGTMYRKDIKGILPEMMEMCVVGRKSVKKEMLVLEQEYQNTKDKKLSGEIAALNNKQLALKLIGNSLYGAVSNFTFRYFDIRIAEAITLSGQASNMHLVDSMNAYLNKVLKTDKDFAVAGDTDSAYLCFSDLVDKVCGDKTPEQIVKFLDKLGNTEMQKVINGSVDTIFDLCNCKEKVMASKREAIAESAIFVGKKAYCMKVLNSEGVDFKPYKLKIMGLVMIKSQTPKLVRSWLKEALTVIFEKGESALHNYVRDCREKFMASPIEDIAFPRGVSEIDKWYDPIVLTKPSTPIHVRAAILYNHYTDPKQYQRIRNGDKMRFCYLKMPNTIKQNVFGWPADSKMPEIDPLVKFLDSDKKHNSLERYIDRELQWEKCFVKSLEALTKPIGWEVEKTSSLSDFFG